MVTDDQIRLGTSAVRAGARTTVALALAGLLWVVAQDEQPHRAALIAITVTALADGLAMSWVPIERVIARGRLPLLLMGWNLAHVVAIAGAATLDGGLSSPFAAMFFVSVVFSALTLSPPRLVAVAAWSAAGLLAVGLLGGDAGLLAIYVPCVLVIGLLGATIAGELARRVCATQRAQEETIERLARAVEFRDASTGGHIDRMAHYAGLLAGRLGLPEAECELLRRAGPLHDVGKLAVPDRILLEPGPLTVQDRLEMERHARAGHELLRDSESELVRLGAVIALSHHERWDGRGYPEGRAAEDIPLPARIVAVADVFDALTSDRVYRPALPFEQAVAIVREGRGTRFDPRVVDAFESALPVIAEISSRRAPGAARGGRAAHGTRDAGGLGSEPDADRPVLA